MRFRIKTSSSSHTLNDIPETLSFREFLLLIEKETGIPSATITIKAGYPPKIISVPQNSVPLSQIETLSNGDTLIVSSPVQLSTSETPNSIKKQSNNGYDYKPQSKINTLNNNNDHSSISEPDNEKHYVKCRDGYMIKRDIPDDNSCLFRAVSYLVHGTQENFYGLRTVISDSITNSNKLNSTSYSEAILGRPVPQYCNWIMQPNSWGGAIELQILADWFSIEIVTVDIKTGTHYVFGLAENKYTTRIYLLYSGIHYDAIVFNPSLSVNAYSNDTLMFPASDSHALDCAIQLSKLVRSKSGFTDTTSFKLLCLDCNTTLVGEKNATIHASKTGHTNFTESK
ncbi:Ubiquitin thioesterase OTU1 [Smittium culicis]|uniref:Ubiquitin thioesterase OTU n=1 Tax=Smittium culicis TaxID=133412 RepID=A0A1R1Y3D0_9FUNG|nr:Ubiquitin thioesterase OTU1 [Smittium culicis]